MRVRLEMAYKPYRVQKKQDVYSKYNNETNSHQKKNSLKEDKIKLFGFRSGLSYKMIPAILYYAFMLFYIATGIYGEIKYYSFETMDVVLTVIKYIFFFILFFSPAIFLSDFKYRESLPFFKKRKTGATIIGLIIVWMFCYLMVNINIYCMSDTWKQSRDSYNQFLLEQQSKSTQNGENNGQ
jgi:hypothetical protein